MSGEPALFEAVGGTDTSPSRWLPSDYARGPWNPDALHGGPVAALAARSVEQCDAPVPMDVSRLTIELLRPVPVAPLTVEVSVARPGRRVQLVDVRISCDDTDVAWARALRVRQLPADSPSAAGIDWEPAAAVAGSPPPPPWQGTPLSAQRAPLPPRGAGAAAFHSTGAELRFVDGEFGRRGPATAWIRLAVPVVAGEVPTPLQRVAAAADFANGISSVVDFEHHVFINPDLTVYLQRPAIGEWVCLEACTSLGAPGEGVAESRLWDVEGAIGRCVQSLLVERRG